MGVASVWMRREVRRNWAETEGPGVNNNFGDVLVRVELGVLGDDDEEEEGEESSSSMSTERN
jgi:hypothetical protein